MGGVESFQQSRFYIALQNDFFAGENGTKSLEIPHKRLQISHYYSDINPTEKMHQGALNFKKYLFSRMSQNNRISRYFINRKSLRSLPKDDKGGL